MTYVLFAHQHVPSRFVCEQTHGLHATTSDSVSQSPDLRSLDYSSCIASTAFWYHIQLEGVFACCQGWDPKGRVNALAMRPVLSIYINSYMHAAGTRVAGTERARHQNQDGNTSKVWLVTLWLRTCLLSVNSKSPVGLQQLYLSETDWEVAQKTLLQVHTMLACMAAVMSELDLCVIAFWIMPQGSR